MEILLVILAYLAFGLVVFFGMVFLEKCGVDFEIKNDVGAVLIITLIISPIILSIIYPIFIAKHLLR